MTDALAKLIAEERAAMIAAGSAKEATWKALEASVAAGAPAPIDLPPLAGALPLGWIAGLIGGAGGLAVVAYLAATPRPIEVEPLPPPPPPPPAIVEEPPPPPPPAPVVREQPAKRTRSKPTFAMQVAELRRAQLAFSRGNAEQALELVADHRKKFPKTPLEQERSALEALASCRMGRPEGPELAKAFLAAWPESPQADRVRRACE